MRHITPLLVALAGFGCGPLGGSPRQPPNLPAEQVETPQQEECDRIMDQHLAKFQLSRSQPSWSYTFDRWTYGCVAYQLMVELKDSDPGDELFQVIKHSMMCNMCEEKRSLDYQVDRNTARALSPTLFVSTSTGETPEVWGWCPDEASQEKPEQNARSLTPGLLQEITVTTRSHTTYTPGNSPAQLAVGDTFIAWPLIRPERQRMRSDLPEFYEGAGCKTWQLPVAGYEEDESRPRMAWQRVPGVPWPQDFHRVGVCTQEECLESMSQALYSK